MTAVGSTRTGEELRRTFPGIPVVVSRTRGTHGVVDEVDDAPRLVVATPGAEPVIEGGYRAILLLNGTALSSHSDPDTAGETLRQWSSAVVLTAPSACVVLLGDPEPMATQALMRWDQAGLVHRDLLGRADLHLSPVWRMAHLSGPVHAVESLLAQAEVDGFEVLGPVAPSPVHGRVLPDITRALVRAPLSHGKALATMLGV